MSTKVKFTVAIIFVLLLLKYSSVSIVASLEMDVENTIKIAEQRIVEAYIAVLEAEHVEADIYQLIESLNEQLVLLNLAKAELELGNTTSAEQYAQSIIETADLIRVEASTLKDNAIAMNANKWIVPLSILLAISILSGILYYYLAKLWHKRRIHRVLEKEIKYKNGENKVA